MRRLTPEGQQIINKLTQRYNFSPEAVFSLLQSVINGNGSMAQFNHPEFEVIVVFLAPGYLALWRSLTTRNSKARANGCEAV
jgi:hypothetical protein